MQNYLEIIPHEYSLPIQKGPLIKKLKANTAIDTRWFGKGCEISETTDLLNAYMTKPTVLLITL